MNGENTTLVVVFLRGGADGLECVPPVGDDDYFRARPTLGIAAHRALALNDFFALHPRLRPLERVLRDGHLSVVHACGSQDRTRSHFDAQDWAERAGVGRSGGWLGRFLRSQSQLRGAEAELGAIDALSLGKATAESLRGAPMLAVFESLEDLRGGERIDVHRDGLSRLYAADPMLAAPAHAAAVAAARLAHLTASSGRPRNGAEYPRAAEHGALAERFGAKLALLARLVHGGLAPRAACVDLDGWDSHLLQASLLDAQLAALGSGLAAFAQDLGPSLDATSIVVMTEFGRRVAENSALGTDHGLASAMLVLGGRTPGNVVGGPGSGWPGLGASALDGAGDVAVVHDYRDVLAAVLARHGPHDPAVVFPEHRVNPIAV